MARNKQNSNDTLVIDLTQIETPGTCKNCKHWKTEQSIFDFQKTKGICLEAPKNTKDCSVSHIGNDEKHVNERNIACSYFFAGDENTRARYFITTENFGCIKFELNK